MANAKPSSQSVRCACGVPIPSVASPLPAYCPIHVPAISAPSQTNAIILAPVPQPLPFPLASPPTTSKPPSKCISSPDDIRRFHPLDAGCRFLDFVADLSHSVHGRKLSAAPTKALTSLLSFLQTLISWIDKIPLLPHSARYSNPAYRSWHAHLSVEAPALLTLLPFDELRPAADELLPYLLDSFSNASRIDYSTGHKTNFAAFLTKDALAALAALIISARGGLPISAR